jgi:hypothetical protein
MLQTQNPTWYTTFFSFFSFHLIIFIPTSPLEITNISFRAAIMRVVFYSFMQIFPETEYWKVRQAYKYIEDHWEKLCPGKTRMHPPLFLYIFMINASLEGVGAWRKQLQDALSHNKQYFISGMHIYGQKGIFPFNLNLSFEVLT